jgi:1-acyl-sn-glycerol-3-phosphate acyltransferase
VARDGGVDLIPAAPSPRVRAVFAGMVSRMMRRRFHAVRLARGSREALAALDGGARPAVAVMNHCAWWDPIVLIVLWREFFPTRAPFGPIDARELRRFAIFRKVGLFGVDPDDPRTLDAMRAYVSELAAKDPRIAFVLTPQGRFADVRDEVVPRPGAAALAAELAPDRAVAIAVEYGFWVDQKPEVFLRAVPVDCAPGGLLAWQRRFTEAMRANQAALAELVRARDAAAFEPLSARFAPRSGGTNPVYDLWMRLTGRAQGELGSARRDDGGAAHREDDGALRRGIDGALRRGDDGALRRGDDGALRRGDRGA